MAASSTPHSAGPESAIGIAEDRNRKASIRQLGRTRDALALDQDLPQVLPRPNPERRDEYEGHKLMTPLSGSPLLLPLAGGLPRGCWRKSKPNSRDETGGDEKRRLRQPAELMVLRLNLPTEVGVHLHPPAKLIVLDRERR
jgi:hypothetical protein